MLLSALAIVLIVFPLTEGHLHHWPLWCFALLAAGLLVLGVFLRHQQRKQGNAPLVALSLFRSRQFSGGMAAQLMHGLLCGLFFMTWTLYLQRGLGMSPFHAALAFVLLSLGELAGATVTAKSGGRFARRLPQAGALITLASMAAYGLQVDAGQAGLTLVAMTAPVVLIGFGLGMVGGPLADMSLARVPPRGRRVGLGPVQYRHAPGHRPRYRADRPGVLRHHRRLSRRRTQPRRVHHACCGGSAASSP